MSVILYVPYSRPKHCFIHSPLFWITCYLYYCYILYYVSSSMQLTCRRMLTSTFICCLLVMPTFIFYRDKFFKSHQAVKTSVLSKSVRLPRYISVHNLRLHSFSQCKTVIHCVSILLGLSDIVRPLCLAIPSVTSVPLQWYDVIVRLSFVYHPYNYNHYNHICFYQDEQLIFWSIRAVLRNTFMRGSVSEFCIKYNLWFICRLDLTEINYIINWHADIAERWWFHYSSHSNTPIDILHCTFERNYL